MAYTQCTKNMMRILIAAPASDAQRLQKPEYQFLVLEWMCGRAAGAIGSSSLTPSPAAAFVLLNPSRKTTLSELRDELPVVDRGILLGVDGVVTVLWCTRSGNNWSRSFGSSVVAPYRRDSYDGLCAWIRNLSSRRLWMSKVWAKAKYLWKRLMFCMSKWHLNKYHRLTSNQCRHRWAGRALSQSVLIDWCRRQW